MPEKKLWTRTYSTRDQAPTCPIFTRTKIKSRFGILKNLPSHCLTRTGSQKTWVFISLRRLQIRHSKILLILARPLPIGYFTFYYFSFFLIFNRMDAWSLMRGDAFIHFVCGSRRVNIRLGALLLIPKSPHMTSRWPLPLLLRPFM